MSGRPLLSGTTGKVVIGLAFLALFLTVGVPKWLNSDNGSGPRAATDFARVCRDAGGTPKTVRDTASGTAEQRCTVRYGDNVYLMDAVTPNGFDQDTAHFQRVGCDEARRQEKATAKPGEKRRVFIYHADTGVCEHRP